MSEEESQDLGGGDAGEEEVLDTLLPGSDDEDNFIDEDEAADRRKRAPPPKPAQNGSPRKNGGAAGSQASKDDKEEQGAEEETVELKEEAMEAEEDTTTAKNGAAGEGASGGGGGEVGGGGEDGDDDTERKKKELQRRRQLIEAENAEREKALEKLKEEAMEFDETEREKKKRLEEEARKIKEKIKQELKTQEASKAGEKRKNEDNSDSEDSDSDSSDSGDSDSDSDSDSGDDEKKKEEKTNGDAKKEKESRDEKDNREGRTKRISPIRFEPSTSDRRNTGDLLDDRVEDHGPPGEMSRPGGGGGGGGAGGGARSAGPVDFTNKLKYIFRDARFFLMKSHNFENVSLAKAKGVWSTPPQNEYKINQAFDQCSNVILIFSVKESGRFQGYARVAAESSHNIPPVNWVLPPGLNSKALGGIFKIDWVSRKDLSFNITSHLYNRWNDGKPVKIGRDGQEIEPITGDQLCRLFPADENIDIAAIAHKAKVKYRTKRDSLGEDALKQLSARNGDRSGGRGGGGGVGGPAGRRRSMSPGGPGAAKRPRRSEGDYDSRSGGYGRRREDGPSYSDYMRTYHTSKGMYPPSGPPVPYGWGGPYDDPSRADRSYEKDVEAFLRQTSSSGRSSSSRRPGERGGKERRGHGSGSPVGEDRRRERDGKRRERDDGGRSRDAERGRGRRDEREEDRRRDRR